MDNIHINPWIFMNFCGAFYECSLFCYIKKTGVGLLPYLRVEGVKKVGFYGAVF